MFPIQADCSAHSLWNIDEAQRSTAHGTADLAECFPSTLGMISANLCNVGPGDTFFLLIATDTASLIRRKCARFCSHQTLLLLLRLRLFAVSFTMREVFHAPGPPRQNLIGALFSQCGELCHFSPQLCSCKKYSHMICKQLFITESTAFFFHSAPTRSSSNSACPQAPYPASLIVTRRGRVLLFGTKSRREKNKQTAVKLV